MKPLVCLLIWLALCGCKGNSNQIVATSRDWPSEQDSIVADSASHYYKILRVSRADNFQNVAILIDSTSLFPNQIIKRATLFKSIECQAQPCHVITIWDNERALRLYENKKNDPVWRRKHWPFICEHYVADYHVTVSEMNLYPFMDSAYHHWGGKSKRPNKHSFDMP